MNATEILISHVEIKADTRTTPAGNALNWIIGASWCIGSLCLALSLISAVRQAPYAIENDHRLAPSAGLLHGYPLYSPENGGPVLSTIYGPFTAFAYLPAAWIPNPVWAVYCGVLISLCLFFLPAALLLRQLASRMRSGRATWLGAIFFFALIALALPSLSYAATFVHADAPAIGAATLSCCFLLREKRTLWRFENLVFAGALAGVSAFAKQNMIPFVAAAALWLVFRAKFTRQGWIRAIWFLSAAGGMIASVILLLRPWLGDARTVLFNIVVIPAHQPYLNVRLFEALQSLQFQALIFLVPSLMLAGWRIARDGSQEPRRPEWLFIFSALALSLTGVLGMIKYGGNVNAIAPPCYFALLAFCFSLCKPAPRGMGIQALRPSPAILAMCVLTFLFGPLDLVKALSTLRHNNGPSLVEQVYRFDRKHPGQVYFPEYPLAVLDAEGRLYNFAWGLQDRAIAGYKVPPEQFFRYVPHTALAAVNVPVPYMEQEFLSLCHADATAPSGAGLDGFHFCRMEPAGAASH